MTHGHSNGNGPDLDAAKAIFARFCTTIAALRHPQSGCPWDLEQDHFTLRRYMLEEAYEAVEAMAASDDREICGELGDVLLQVVLNAQVAQDRGAFDVVDVVRGIDEKMRRRHPHVFGSDADKSVSVDQVRSTWDVIKAGEAAEKGVTKPASIMKDAEKKQPATNQALKIGKIARKVRFDWESPAEVFQQLRSEIDELEAELARPTQDPAKVAAEVGDVYFSLAQLCRHLEIDPETTAVDGNRKFLRRFAKLEELAAGDGLDVASATRDQLEALWRRAKASERR
jgi:MazG family protein